VPSTNLLPGTLKPKQNGDMSPGRIYWDTYVMLIILIERKSWKVWRIKNSRNKNLQNFAN
jgi:hypothetical protein